jgi:hypothetical protein
MSELAKALVQFQKKTAGFEADKQGNRSKYASIGAVISNVKQAAQYGLAFTQEVDFEGDMIFVRSVMLHESGEKRESRYPVIVDDRTNNQKVGGAITYAKRYGLASLFGTEKGVEDADNDGADNGYFDDEPKGTSSLLSGSPPDSATKSVGSGAAPLTLDEELQQAKTRDELVALFNKVKPTDQHTIQKFSKRKDEISGQ